MNVKLKKWFNSAVSVTLVALIAVSQIAFGFTASAGSTPTTIVLTADSQDPITVNQGDELILDLNGHNLTSSTNTVITNNGTLTVKDSVGTGKITKVGTADTIGIKNNGTLTVEKANFNISTTSGGVAYGIYNETTGSMSFLDGDINSYTTSSDKWAYGILNKGTITEISGGTIKGTINKDSNSFNSLGISNESGATINSISGGLIAAEVNNNGYAFGLRNTGIIESISGGEITGINTGTKWTFAIFNTANGTINSISDCKVNAALTKSNNTNNALAISNEGTINAISGGQYTATTAGSGGAIGIRSRREGSNTFGGVVSNVSGGVFNGNAFGRAVLVENNGTITYATGYSLSTNSNAGNYRYVLKNGEFFVHIENKISEWIASYVFDSDGKTVVHYGDNSSEFTLNKWDNSQSTSTVVCTVSDLSKIGSNKFLTMVDGDVDDIPIMYFLGSSVTYGHANNGVSFVDYLAQDNGWVCNKYAVSGTTLVNNGSNSYIARMKDQISTNAQMDMFTCQLSTNDATGNQPLGTMSSSKDITTFDQTKIIGAMEYIIGYAQQTWNCPVVFYTNPKYDSALYKKMVDALYTLKEKWDIEIIDFYNYVEMDPLTQSVLNSYMADAIHPNAQGYHWMTNVMTRAYTNILENNYIEITNTNNRISVGNTLTLTKQSNPADSACTFSSDNTDVATVNNAGVVTGVSVGTANIKVTATDTKRSDTYTVKVLGDGIVDILCAPDKQLQTFNDGTPQLFKDYLEFPLGTTGSWNFISKATLGANKVYKTTYFMTVNNGTGEMKFNPFGTDCNYLFYKGKSLSQFLTKKIAFTVVFKTKAEATDFTVGGVLSSTFSGKLDKIIISEGNADMSQYTDSYYFVEEGTPNQTDGLGNTTVPEASEYTTQPVVAPVEGVTTTPEITLYMGGTTTSQIEATVLPENAFDKTVTYSTSNKNIATVNSSGLVTAVSAGTANITVMAKGSKKSVTTVRVLPALSSSADILSLTFAKVSATISSTNINVTVPYGTSLKQIPVLTISDKATVTTNLETLDYSKPVTITVKAENNTERTYTLNVKVAAKISVSKITLSKTKATLSVGDKININATVSPKNATSKNIIWKSSKTSVATVTSAGKVTAKAPGVAKITASIDGKTATFTIAVNPNKPKNFKVKKSGKKAIISFKKGAGSSKTKIYIKIGKKVTTKIVSGSSYKLSLEKGSYKIRICAYSKISGKEYVSSYTSYKSIKA